MAFTPRGEGDPIDKIIEIKEMWCEKRSEIADNLLLPPDYENMIQTTLDLHFCIDIVNEQMRLIEELLLEREINIRKQP